MNITIRGITKDCTEWGCENVVDCEHGCIGFAPKTTEDLIDYKVDNESVKRNRTETWWGNDPDLRQHERREGKWLR
jgi:hypothetical protein